MTRQPGSLRRKLLILAVAIAIFFLIAIAAGVAVFFSPLLTRYVEGDAFRIAMEEETAKGLHFPQARYASIRRTRAFTAQSDNLKADNGQKAMKSLDAHSITAKFPSLGRVLATMALHRRARASWRRRDPDLRSSSGTSETEAVVRNFFAEQSLSGEDRIGTRQYNLALSR